MKSGKFGLTIQKKSDNGPQQLIANNIASVFNTNSDEEGDKMETVDAKFQRKYAVPIKRKDRKIVEEAIEEDPTIFDYDSQFERMQEIRDQKVLEQKEADKDKKPKYAHKLIETHKRRELEKLLHDERTYKKEREKESGEFDDKEVFITGEYRKQIEEREKFRKELEQSDKMDELRDVKDQKMWQQAFHRKILDDRARIYPNNSIKEEVSDIKEEKIEEKIKKENKIKDEIEGNFSELHNKNREKQKDENKKKSRDDKCRRERNRSKSPEILKELSESENEKKRFLAAPSLSYDDGINEEVRRMEKISQILRRRNDENSIAEARLRYFQRKEQGEILPPY